MCCGHNLAAAPAACTRAQGARRCVPKRSKRDERPPPRTRPPSGRSQSPARPSTARWARREPAVTQPRLLGGTCSPAAGRRQERLCRPVDCPTPPQRRTRTDCPWVHPARRSTARLAEGSPSHHPYSRRRVALRPPGWQHRPCRAAAASAALPPTWRAAAGARARAKTGSSHRHSHSARPAVAGRATARARATQPALKSEASDEKRTGSCRWG